MLAVRVDYLQNEALEHVAELSAMSSDIAGLSHAATVQIVTGLAVARAMIACPGSVRAAFVSTDGEFKGTKRITRGDVLEVLKGGHLPAPDFFPIVGELNAPARKDGADLVYAIDALLKRIKKARQAASVPAHGVPGFVPVLPLVHLVVIVVGFAASILATVAIWRFTDPTTRLGIEAVSASSAAYLARLEMFQKTGTMPPPSEIEKSTADRVRSLADEGRSAGWLEGGLVLGGIFGGVALSGAISRASS